MEKETTKLEEKVATANQKLKEATTALEAKLKEMSA